jgi:undecaprenyl-diphosphatase
MPLWEATLLGVIQGLTEFLPISSTAHLLVTRELLGHPDPKDSFTTVVQLGTLVAVFVYFRADVVRLLRAVWGDAVVNRLGSSADSRLAYLIAVGTVPAGAVGFLFQRRIKEVFYNTRSMAVVAIAFALLMLAAEVWHRRRKRPAAGEDGIGWTEAVWMGVWQMLALMPGASRSGTTISGGLFAGLNRAAAARFSFLLSLPTILAAGLKDLYDEAKAYRTTGTGLFASGDQLAAVAVGTAVSGVVGYLSIAWLLGFLRKYSMNVFVAYRVALGLALLALVARGVVR